jgi:hypothetical protein
VRHSHGFSIAILSPFAHEAEDEDDLRREPEHFASEGDSDRELDLRIKLCESELAYLRALKNGNQKLAEAHRKEARKYDRALSDLLRGHHDEDEGDEHGDE